MIFACYSADWQSWLPNNAAAKKIVQVNAGSKQHNKICSALVLWGRTCIQMFLYVPPTNVYITVFWQQNKLYDSEYFRQFALTPAFSFPLFLVNNLIILLLKLMGFLLCMYIYSIINLFIAWGSCVCPGGMLPYNFTWWRLFCLSCRVSEPPI